MKKIDIEEVLHNSNNQYSPYKQLQLVRKYIDELKAENERLKECEALTHFKNLSNDDRIKSLQQQLKTNTKQVCDKIREKLNNIPNDGECKIHNIINEFIDADIIYEILDQIEKGETENEI